MWLCYPCYNGLQEFRLIYDCWDALLHTVSHLISLPQSETQVDKSRSQFSLVIMNRRVNSLLETRQVTQFYLHAGQICTKGIYFKEERNDHINCYMANIYYDIIIKWVHPPSHSDWKIVFWWVWDRIEPFRLRCLHEAFSFSSCYYSDYLFI